MLPQTSEAEEEQGWLLSHIASSISALPRARFGVGTTCSFYLRVCSMKKRLLRPPPQSLPYAVTQFLTGKNTVTFLTGTWFCNKLLKYKEATLQVLYFLSLIFSQIFLSPLLLCFSLKS